MALPLTLIEGKQLVSQLAEQVTKARLVVESMESKVKVKKIMTTRMLNFTLLTCLNIAEVYAFTCWKHLIGLVNNIMKHILAIILLSFSLNTFAEEAIETPTQEAPPLSFGQYVELFAGLISIAMGNPAPKPVQTESEYWHEINRKADVILYNVKTDVMIKNWGKE